MRRVALTALLLVLLLLGAAPAPAGEEAGAEQGRSALTELLGMLRLRMEARIKEGEALAHLGRMEEALQAYRDVKGLYDQGLAEVRRLAAQIAGKDSAPKPGTARVRPLPAPSAPVSGPLAEDEVPEEAVTDGWKAVGGGRAFKGRGGSRDLGNGAGRKKFDDAVDDGLRWLAAHQAPNGGWGAADFNRFCDGKPVARLQDMPDGTGKAIYDAGVTGLALCAFLGAGYTQRGKHPFARAVSRGLQYLVNVQDPEGCFGPRATQQYIYNHAIAALAMVEAYGMTGSPVLKGPAQKALDFIALARNPYFAWRYGIKPGDNDTSVTGWMVMGLKSAQLINQAAVANGRPAPLTIDEAAFDGTHAWLDKVTDPDYGRVGYVQRGTGPARPMELVDRFPGEKSESMTAVGILCRTFLGEDPRRSKLIKLGADLCAKLPPVWNPSDGSIDMIYWYYGTLAMYQVGGRHWNVWKNGLERAVHGHQRKDTDYCLYKGSWDPIGPWGLDGGRVYSTAMMTLCLEVFYRYERVFGAR